MNIFSTQDRITAAIERFRMNSRHVDESETQRGLDCQAAQREIAPCQAGLVIFVTRVDCSFEPRLDLLRSWHSGFTDAGFPFTDC